jgi:hypothetical protein
MIPPLILFDKGDVLLFQSVDELQSYIESPDVSNYRLFDADGQVLSLSVVAPDPSRKKPIELVSVSRVVVGDSREKAATELELLLRDFLSRATGKNYMGTSLHDLLVLLQTTIGFTH